jgi:hypothetical protein
MRVQAELLEHALQQFQLNLERVCGCKAGAVADAEDVGVDGQRPLLDRAAGFPFPMRRQLVSSNFSISH